MQSTCPSYLGNVFIHPIFRVLRFFDSKRFPRHSASSRSVFIAGDAGEIWHGLSSPGRAGGCLSAVRPGLGQRRRCVDQLFSELPLSVLPVMIGVLNSASSHFKGILTGVLKWQRRLWNLVSRFRQSAQAPCEVVWSRDVLDAFNERAAEARNTTIKDVRCFPRYETRNQFSSVLPQCVDASGADNALDVSGEMVPCVSRWDSRWKRRICSTPP